MLSSLKRYRILLTIILVFPCQIKSIVDIKAWSTPEIIYQGYNTSLYCAVNGDLNADVKWSRDGGVELENDHFRYERLKPGEFMIINSDITYDKGTYTCRFRNGSMVYQAKILLSIKPTVELCDKSNQSPKKRHVGDTVSFPCKILDADPTVTITLSWQLNGTEINFKNQSHITKTLDNTLEISNLKVSDSGSYDCVASAGPTSMSDTKKGVLIVQDAPNPPKIIHSSCYGYIQFECDDNNSPIEKYYIQYNTSFHPDDTYDTIPAELDILKGAVNFTLTPWKNYTFRLIVENEIGKSLPSEPSEICRTEANNPDENPVDVRGEGTTPDNLVIYWKPMTPMQHYGPDFRYLVQWKRDLQDAKWTTKVCYDVEQSNFTVPNQPTFVRYYIKVWAANKKGRSSTNATEIIGYSGEDKPTESPTNLTVTSLTEIGSVMLKWEPVSSESLNGHFNGYLIEYWYVSNNMEVIRKLNASADDAEFKINNLFPHVTYYFRMYAQNSRYIGPSSESVNIQLFDGVPSSVQHFQAYLMGSNAFLLRWTRPIYCTKVVYYKIGYRVKHEGNEKFKNIEDDVTQTKIPALMPDTEYRFCIVASSSSKEGEQICITAETKPNESIQPDAPDLKWKFLTSRNEFLRIKIQWLPNIEGKPGSNFYVKYRVKSECKWSKTEVILKRDYVVIDTFVKNITYEIMTVSVDGNFTAESPIQLVPNDKIDGGHEDVHPNPNSFSAGSIILIVAAVTLTPILLFFGFKFAPAKYRLAVRKAIHWILRREMIDGQFVYFKYYKTGRANSINPLYKFNEGNVDGINPALTLCEQADLLPYDKNYEFPRENLQLGKQLGAGAFGVVFKANAKGILVHEEVTTVAVKTIKSIATHEAMYALILELKIMIYLGQHLNVVNLLGAVTKNIGSNELMVIVEYCRFGNLQNFLVKNSKYFIDQINHDTDKIDHNTIGREIPGSDSRRVVSTRDLLCWSFQIARGMDYLASRKVLHGDLAARNILLCDENVVKICDFGLARSMYKTGNYQIKTKRALPLKWLAIESISKQVFSTHSDVWSFGIVLWELFSLGATPYPGINGGTELFQKLKDGYRMEKPEYATQEIYDIMLSCWQFNPELRPPFDKLETRLTHILDKGVSEYYVMMNEPYLFENEKHLKSKEIDFSALLTAPNSEAPKIPERHKRQYQNVCEPPSSAKNC